MVPCPQRPSHSLPPPPKIDLFKRIPAPSCIPPLVSGPPFAAPGVWGTANMCTELLATFNNNDMNRCALSKPPSLLAPR